ncbi:MAG: leucine-rich repeat protein [Acutalibacteraceae bacterium]
MNAIWKNKGTRALLIILIAVIVVAAVSAGQKHFGDKNAQTESMGEASDSPADLVGTQPLIPDVLNPVLPSGPIVITNANTSSLSEGSETSELTGLSSQGDSSTKHTEPEYSIDKNEFNANIQGDFKYSVTDGYAVIDTYLGNGGTVRIPANIGGHKVYAVGGSSFSGIGGGSGQKITSVIIASGIERIEGKAFSSCINLSSVTIPDSVNYISEFAFEGCPNLVIKCSASSFARSYASENNIVYTN